MDNRPNTLGEKITELRKENNMSQENLAEKLNVSRQAVSNWERNKSIPDISAIAKICELFGTNMDSMVRSEYSMLTKMKHEENHARNENINKYDMAVGLFYAVALFLSVGIFLVVGLIFGEKQIWLYAAVGCAFLFLALGLLAHAIITLARKDKQYNDD